MYAKNLPVPPKFEYPYQQQQRYSGSFIVSDVSSKPKELAAETLKQLEEAVQNLSPVKK